MTRRGLLVGLGLGATAVATGAVVVAGHRDGTDGVVPDVRPGRRITGALTSEARLGRRCGWTIALPAGSPRDVPVAVVLHGRGNDHRSVFDPGYLGLDRFLAAAVDRGTAPFALASIDGGESYWHARDAGDDAAAMVTDEFLPLLASRGLDTRRVGLMGWSMGGYGALHLAGLLGAERVAAVAAMSPALWHTYADTAPGAFDSEEDFGAATVLGRQAQLDGTGVRVDCGTGDPFYATTKDYVGGFDPPPSGGFEPGDHDIGYWRRLAGPQLRFVGDRLV